MTTFCCIMMWLVSSVLKLPAFVEKANHFYLQQEIPDLVESVPSSGRGIETR